MSENSFDIVVIGAGPGGYVCAIQAAKLGLKTALVEKSKNLGGTCLNVGCIPSKALLQSTEMYAFLHHKGASHGIKAKDLSIDLKALMQRKDSVVETLRKGVKALVSKNKITLFQGHGKLLAKDRIAIKGDKETNEITAKNIVLATGSKVTELPFLQIDDQRIISSDQAIALEEIPDKLVVVGGGAIGLELGSVWSRLGCKVTVLEFLPQIAAGFDKDVSQMAERIFKKQGMDIRTQTEVKGIQDKKGSFYVLAENKGRSIEIEADKVLVAVGRAPYHQELGLETVGVQLDEKNRVITDADFQTNVPGIYAVGDIVAGPMLAHKAEEEGVAVAKKIAGRHGEVNHELIPNVIYTEPEIASVGLTELSAQAKGIKVKTGKFPIMANGRAIASDATDGFVKVIAADETDRLLGIQIIAYNASELIASAVAHMEYGGSAEDLALTVHAHPTLSESLKEAALDVDKNAIHM